jgi:micrococcal nuclease
VFKKAFLALLFLFISVGVCSASNTYIISKVIDGDTFVLSNGEHVRLVGIDTPESRINAKLERDNKRTGEDAKTVIEMGKKATEFTRKLVEGKKVYLEYDIQQRDRYGRLLAYVYLIDKTDTDEALLEMAGLLNVPSGDLLRGNLKGAFPFVNATIIKAGYAQVMTVPPNVKYQELFLELEKEAREQRRGLWE